VLLIVNKEKDQSKIQRDEVGFNFFEGNVFYRKAVVYLMISELLLLAF